MNSVFVINTNKRPQPPIHPAKARQLLRDGEAAVWRRFPFTIILRTAIKSAPEPKLRLKLDPGSKTTGIALVDDEAGRVVFAAELEHHGERIKADLTSRRETRRSRRGRKTRYRRARFDNRRRPEGWLAPSLMSRVYNIETWVHRFRKLAPIGAISVETARFDTQLLVSPDISGVRYQQGTLFGYEVREYLLEKYHRTCVYCGAKNTPLEIDHVWPKSRGGSDRIANLVIACHDCNQVKGNQTAAEFGHANVEMMTGRPKKDVAAMNSTRKELLRSLGALGLPLEVGTGGRTRYNRTRLGLEKSHWADAACVGASTPQRLHVPDGPLLRITATGHGSRRMCAMDRFGFPRTSPKRFRTVRGFRTGDLVRAIIPGGKNHGTHFGRVMVRTSGSFDIRTAERRIGGVSHRHCTVAQRNDGYSYTAEAPTPAHSSPS